MDDVSKVREKVDIVALLSEYISLKKAGRNFKALCPFHGEKTASFVVSPERQIWHCFGCSKGGDIFSFLMEYEHLEFPEALRLLAKRAGVELTQSQLVKGVYSKKENIYRVNNHAMQFYHYLLTKHNIGKKAHEYLIKKRGMNTGSIKTFRLGFAPSLGNSASVYLTAKKGYTKEELIDAGLAFVTGGDLVDFFKGRIIFPLIDHRENVVGFSGRSLLEDAQSKYINTRETSVYHKGSHFFGIHSAKEAIKKEDKAIVVEGEFDVISAFQQGFKNVVAVKGSSLTDEQANLLSRFTHKIALCFDNDDAGIEAMKRSLPTLENKRMEITVIFLKNGKDPDEVLKADPVSFKKSLGENLSVYDFFISKSIQDQNTKDPLGKKRIADELLPLISSIENEIVKEHYLKKLSKILDVSLDSVFAQIEKIKKTSFLHPGATEKQPTHRGRNELLEEYLLALVIQHESPQSILTSIQNILANFNFANPSVHHIFDRLREYCKSHVSFNSRKFAQTLPLELLHTFDTSYLLPVSKFQNNEMYEKEVEKIARELRILDIKSKIKSISETIKKEEKTSTAIHLKNLQKELSLLGSTIKNGFST